MANTPNTETTDEIAAFCSECGTSTIHEWTDARTGHYWPDHRHLIDLRLKGQWVCTGWGTVRYTDEDIAAGLHR